MIGLIMTVCLAFCGIYSLKMGEYYVALGCLIFSVIYYIVGYWWYKLALMNNLLKSNKEAKN